MSNARLAHYRSFGRLEITAIRSMHILAFRQAMASKNLSIARQYGLLMTLKLFLKFCRTVLELNCIDPSTIKLPARKAPKVEYLTNSEIKAIRHNIDPSRISGVRLRALFETLLATGMRISEAISLNRDSINKERKEASIIGKGSKIRTVFFSDEALRWIERYLLRRHDSNPELMKFAPVIVTVRSPDPARAEFGDTRATEGAALGTGGGTGTKLLPPLQPGKSAKEHITKITITGRILCMTLSLVS